VSESDKAERDQRLIEQLDAETARLLFPDKFPTSLRVTLEFPALDATQAEANASVLGRAATRDVPAHGDWSATYELSEVEALHELFSLVDETFGADAVEVRINDKVIPMSRELWLPLFWSLRS
jgi:hypothetical protein